MDRTTTDVRPSEADETSHAGASDDRPLTTDDVARGMERSAGRTAVTADSDDGRAPLFERDRADAFRSRWESVQASFVDEPREAVEEADGLVAEIMKELAQTFADERRALEKQWTLGDDVSTEDLRQALRHYRSFFDRLLSL